MFVVKYVWNMCSCAHMRCVYLSVCDVTWPGVSEQAIDNVGDENKLRWALGRQDKHDTASHRTQTYMTTFLHVWWRFWWGFGEYDMKVQGGILWLFIILWSTQRDPYKTPTLSQPTPFVVNTTIYATQAISKRLFVWKLFNITPTYTNILLVFSLPFWHVSSIQGPTNTLGSPPQPHIAYTVDIPSIRWVDCLFVSLIEEMKACVGMAHSPSEGGVKWCDSNADNTPL